MQHKSISLLTAGLLLATFSSGAQASNDDRYTVITGARVIPIEGKEMANAIIVISEGKIENIGPSIEYPKNAKVIDGRGMVVMPGLILADTRAGLPRYRRSGVHGNLLAADEFYRTDDIFEDLLDAGFTTIALRPNGSNMPGRAAIMQTGGEDKDLVLNKNGYLRMASGKNDLRAALKQAQAEIAKVEKAIKENEAKQKKAKEAAEKKAKAEAQKKQGEKKPEQGKEKQGGKPPASQPTSQPASQPAKFEPPKVDPAYQPLVDMIQGKEEVRGLLEANRAGDVIHLMQALEQFEASRLDDDEDDKGNGNDNGNGENGEGEASDEGDDEAEEETPDPLRIDWNLSNTSRQSDLFHMAEALGEQEARVLLRANSHRMPYSAERNPLVKSFVDAGCEVSLMPVRDNSYEYGNYRPHVAQLVRNGLDREMALKAMTLHPARLLGLEETHGTIEKEKHADLIFLDADPLAPGARVRKVMIRGEIVHTVEYDQ